MGVRVGINAKLVACLECDEFEQAQFIALLKSCKGQPVSSIPVIDFAMTRRVFR